MAEPHGEHRFGGHRLARALALAIVALGLGPVAANGQYSGFQPLLDSLQAITDVPLLYRLERSNPLPGSATTLEPLARRGLIALRIWELGRDRADADRSRDLFETATERFPQDPWSHYGFALALSRGPDVQLPLPGGMLSSVTIGQSLAEIFGRDARSRARRALRHALDLDPGFADAAVLLADLAVADGGRRRELIQEARDRLVAVHGAGARTGRTARALGDMEIALGDYAAASAAASDAADAGQLRTRAMALLLQPGREREGALAYWRGVDLLTELAAREYYADVAVLVTPTEAAEWRAADLEAKRVWFDRFWQMRAATGGVTPTERLAEHYRRLAAARSRYVRNSTRGADTQGLLLDGTDPQRFAFDDRGIVLIRHGEPMSVIATGHRGVLPNESWYYELPGQGGQLFHFVAARGTQNYSLVRDVLEAMDPARGMDADTHAGAILALIGERAPYEPRYRAIFARLSRVLQLAPNVNINGTEMRSMLETADAEYRAGARAAMRADSYVRAYTGDIAFRHDVFSFRTPESRTELTAAWAVPARDLVPRAVDGGVEYAMQFSLILVDTLVDIVTRRDSIMRFRYAAPLPDDSLIRANLVMTAQPSDDAVYRLAVADSGSGRGRTVTGTEDVRDYTETGVMASDIVLARPDVSGDWERGGQSLALALPREFAPNKPFTIYYELYNIPADAAYSTRITVEPIRRGRLRRLFGGGRIIDVRFDDVALPDEDGVIAETRQLATDLGAGTYRIVVSITVDGRSVDTETEFTVGG